jgi:hypothetical protein
MLHNTTSPDTPAVALPGDALAALVCEFMCFGVAFVPGQFSVLHGHGTLHSSCPQESVGQRSVVCFCDMQLRQTSRRTWVASTIC